MKKDMHYYGVYVLARAAGLSPEAAGRIAMASQYVDDSVSVNTVTGKDGSKIKVETTAHGMVSQENLDPDNQREVWLPFHFLPGGDGSQLTQKFVCRKDSAVAKAMIGHYLDLKDAKFFPELIGVMSHVYADTFSHHGFSGISSRRNRVVGESLKCHNAHSLVGGGILEKIFGALGPLAELMPNFHAIEGEVAEMASGALGHGAVATYPDLPYLTWSFRYEMPEMTEPGAVQRDNPRDFLDACKALHAVYVVVGERLPGLRSGSPISFTELVQALEPVIRTEASEDGLCKAWRDGVQENRFGFSSEGERIPTYETVKGSWDATLEAFAEDDNALRHLDSDVYRFQQAASYHRNYVLRNLLPSMGMMVI